MLRFDNLTVINTHLVSIYASDKRQLLASKRQTKELAGLIAREQGQSQKVILAGDINFGPNSPQYQHLRSLLLDITTDLGESVHLDGRQLDYIFSSDGQAIADVHNHPVNISDHPGVSVFLTF